MKFSSPLIEAVLLKRQFRFLADVAQETRRKKTIYFPNLNPLLPCDVLGSRLWFSIASRLSQGYLDCAELVEVNGGWLVAINEGYATTLVREGIQNGIITELQDYHFLYLNSITETDSLRCLVKENGEQCFVHIEAVLCGDDRGEGYFPETANHSIALLQELIMHKESGARAVLFYCIQNNGINALRPAESIHPTYVNMLKLAQNAGVEILAYRANINLQEINLITAVPVLFSENLVPR